MLTEDTSEDLPAASELPTILMVGDLAGNLSKLTHQALAAVKTHNDQHMRLFQRGGVICRLDQGDEGEPRLTPCTIDMMRGEVARTSKWVKLGGPESDRKWNRVFPSDTVCKDILSRPPQEWPFGVVNRIVRRPIFTADGELLDTPGYHPQARVLYQPPKGFQVPPVPPAPTQAEIIEARDLLIEDVLTDFPFADQASRAHAFAACLQSTARAFIDGITPLWLFDAPAEGTGKSLLAKVILQVGIGGEPALFDAPSSSEEWTKSLTATLIDAPDSVLLDNLSGKLDSKTFAALLTSLYFQGRLLGFSQMVKVRNLAQWVATANNLSMSREIARRTILCRLDSETERPEERGGWKHDPIEGWVSDNLARLTWATLVLVRAWLVAGKPAWKPGEGAKTVGSYELWGRVMGGILDVAGVPGFCTNREAIQERARAGEDEWVEFFTWWRDFFPTAAVGVKDLLPHVQQHGFLPTAARTDKERSLASILGIRLREQIGRIYAGLRLESGGKHRDGGALYRLKAVEQSLQPAPTPQEDVNALFEEPIL